MENLTVSVIGCGGIGSYLIPPLAKTLASLSGNISLILTDGDKFEERNTSRQLCLRRHIGAFKGAAMARDYVFPYENINAEVRNLYIKSSADIPQADVTILCVDNHPARFLVLSDESNRAGLIISAANGSSSAEAFVFHKSWKGIQNLDPLMYYPEIATDTSGVHAGAGCTADAVEQTEAGDQTAAANFIAASLALALFEAWRSNLPDQIRPYLPARLIYNGLSVKTFSVLNAISSETKNNDA